MKAASTSGTVLNGQVALACRDFAGPGPDLVLMHGAGMTQKSLAKLIGHLAVSFRVVTFDFRGHGATTTGPWTMDTAVSDLEAVIRSYGLTNPAVGGHSLGGMVAVEYARRHPDCPGAINIDGQGMGVPEQYVGKDPSLVAAWLQDSKQDVRNLTQRKVIRAMRAIGWLAGTKPAKAEALSAIFAMVDDLDLIAMYAQVRGPLQIFNAYAPSTGLAAKLLRDPHDYASAYRAGIRRDVTQLAKTHPNIALAEIDATHMLILTHPKQTADLMAAFLKRA